MPAGRIRGWLGRDVGARRVGSSPCAIEAQVSLGAAGAKSPACPKRWEPIAGGLGASVAVSVQAAVHLRMNASTRGALMEICEQGH